MSEVLERPKSNRKLLEGEFGFAEYRRQDLIVFPAVGTSIDDMLKPDYWVHVASKMKALDRIEVRPSDGQWWAEMLVQVVEPGAVKVMVLRAVDFSRAASPEAQPVPDGYTIKWRGAARWGVIRDEDKFVLHEGENSREGAEAWLTVHLRKLAA